MTFSYVFCNIYQRFGDVIDVTNENNTGHSFEAYFKRALSPIVVLNLLRDTPKYGYEISAEMKRRSNGRFTISVLYPVLYRLEEQGYVCVAKTEVVNNRARSYYQITSEGRVYLEETKKSFNEMVDIAESLLKEDNAE